MRGIFGKSVGSLNQQILQFQVFKELQIACIERNLKITKLNYVNLAAFKMFVETNFSLFSL